MRALLSFIIVALIPMSALAQVATYGERMKRGKHEAYIAKDGTQYNVGDDVKIGSAQGGHKTFTYIREYWGFTTPSTPCPTEKCSAGRDYRIESFKASGAGMWAMMKPTQGRATMTVDFENALQSGELIGRGYTSDQALAELKKWKDKLDLELITPAEYEAKKAELSPYIR